MAKVHGSVCQCNMSLNVRLRNPNEVFRSAPEAWAGMRCGGEEAVRARLSQDPWTPLKMLEILAIEPWEILLGDVERL